MLAAPYGSTLKGVCDRAMVATMLYCGLRRAELCALHLVDLQDRRKVRDLRVLGQGSNTRYVPQHLAAADAIVAHLEAAGHGNDKAAPVFNSASNDARC